MIEFYDANLDSCAIGDIITNHLRNNIDHIYGFRFFSWGNEDRHGSSRWLIIWGNRDAPNDSEIKELISSNQIWYSEDRAIMHNHQEDL